VSVTGWISRIARRLRDGAERGFSTVIVMGALLVGGLVVVAAFGATQPGIGLSGDDRDRKAAYAAAESGLAYYQFHLDQDVNYWADCKNVDPPSLTEPSPVNDRWVTGPDVRQWRSLPGAPGKYTIELLPATGDPGVCSATTMLDPATGTFRVRSTGVVGDEKRSIIATFRRRGFLDFIYFTEYETIPPLAYSTLALRESALVECVKTARDGRPEDKNSYCLPLQFANGDKINGPFHTNDEILVCNSPTFGRKAADRVEISAPLPRAFEAAQGCGATPNFLGTFVPSADPIALPPDNKELEGYAAAAYTFTGKTTIVLDGNTMTVTNQGVKKTLPLPANGVVYVKSEGCSPTYEYRQVYNAPVGCGEAWVSGSYSKSLTIGTDNDVVIDGNLTKPAGSDALLGLVATNFVRVYHPVMNPAGNCDMSTSSSLVNLTIHAAILALNQSFIVDNFYCGTHLEDLTIKGAVTQKFRGPVGLTTGQGYIKKYDYDDQLRHREPPYFIDPVEAAWRITRQNEQVPSR